MVEIGWIRKLQKHGNSLQLTIPPEVCNGFGLKEGDTVKIIVEGDHAYFSKCEKTICIPMAPIIPSAECPYCKEIIKLEFGEMEKHISDKHPEEYENYTSHWNNNNKLTDIKTS